jgi:hypothetical protein
MESPENDGAVFRPSHKPCILPFGSRCCGQACSVAHPAGRR